MANEKIVAAICVVVLIALPALMYPIFAMKALCFALFAASFNLLMGYVGLTPFGHAMFFGGAAYACAYALKTWGVSPEIGLLLGTLSAMILGAGTAFLSMRRQGVYFGMITLALAQLFYFFCLQARFTGGENGIQSVPRGSAFGVWSLRDDISLYYFIALVFVAAMALLYRIIHSPFGAVLKGIRDNEVRATSLGYDGSRFKIIAFVLSAGLAGLAGAMEVLILQIATLNNVEWTMSGHVVLIALIGGIGTFLGPVVGAFLIVAIDSYLSGAGEWLDVGKGIAFMACVIGFRAGIVGTIVPRLRLAFKVRVPDDVIRHKEARPT